MNNKPIGRFFRYALSLSLLLVLITGIVTTRTAFVYASSITVTTTADEINSNGNCSLREAIQAANTDTVVDACPSGSGTDTIFVPAGTYTLSIPPGADQEGDLPTLSQRNLIGDLDITSNLTIEGAGATNTIIDGAHLDRVIHINIGGTTAGISGVTIQNGDVGAQGGNTISGGGIANGSASLTITDSTIRDNKALYGGGITNGSGSTTLINTTVSGNTASINGGGIYNGGSLTLINTTVSGNTANGNGGGIGSVGGHYSLTNVTLTGNSAGNGGGLWLAFGGTATLKNTIVANSTGGNCSGGVTSTGHNLSSDGNCSSSLTGSGDINNTNPHLGPLADNGGPTKTHALLPESPAIDAGSLDCPPPANDQRGVSRPQGAVCDIGAFELTPFTYNFSGFFQPVDNLPTLNTVKVGQGIPVKFSLNGDQGLDIFAVGFPRSQEINCDTSATLDGIEETLTAGSSSLSYNPDTDTYNYIWKTDNAWASTCRQLEVKLNDGTNHKANFKFK